MSKTEKPQYSAGFFLARSKPVIFEQVENADGQMRYVFSPYPISHNPNVTMGTTDHFEDFTPKPDVGWPLVTEEDVNTLDQTVDVCALWQEIKLYIQEYLDLQDEKAYDVLTAWIFCSYLRERMQSIPYIFFFGLPDTGKTRGLEILQALSYRGYRTVSISSAALYRMIKQDHPTLLLDETDGWVKDYRQEMTAILNSGYRKGDRIARCVGGENARFNLEYFEAFGFKAVAGTDQMKETFESRCIIIPMMKTTRVLEVYPDEERATKLRAKLLFWRFHTLLGEVSEVNEVNFRVGREELPEGLREVKDGRLIELFYPLYRVAPTEESQYTIIQYALEELARRGLKYEASIIGDLLEILVEIASFTTNSFISTRSITDKYNADKPLPKEKYSTRSIGRQLSKLGFTSVHKKGGNGILLDIDLLHHLTQRFNIPFNPLDIPLKKTSQTSLTSPDEEEP